MVCRLLIGLYRAKKSMDEVEAVKIDSHRQQIGLPPMQSWQEEWCETWGVKFKLSCMKCFCPFCVPDYIPRCIVCPNLFVPGAYINDVMKNLVGFLCGLLLSYLWFLFMVYQLGHPPHKSAVTCSILAAILSFGLAFTQTCRCMVLLTIPSICSSKGRTFLVAYMFFLVMSHPVPNFHYNVHVACESALCGQEMVSNATHEMLESALSPVKSIVGKLRDMIGIMKEFAEKIRETFEKVRRLFSEIAGAVKRAFSWLGNMVNICNENMTGPYIKCNKAFDDGYKDCRSNAGIFKFMCGLVKLVRPVCKIAKLGDLLCSLPGMIKNKIKKAISDRLDISMKSVKDLFYFNVTLVYSFEVTFTMSRSFSDVRRDITKEIEDRIKPLKFFIGWDNLSLVFMMSWLAWRAYSYKQKYLSKDKFDNCYISYEVIQIDEKRQELHRETALPLVLSECNRYIYTRSLWLSASERKKLVKGMVLLLLTGVHAGFYILMDGGLFSILSLVRTYNTFDVSHYVPGYIKMRVQGQSYLAHVYRSMISRFDPVGKDDSKTDFMACLPHPSRPDFHMYKVIVGIYSLCLLLVVFQAYCLRLRHIICAYYFPKREKERAAWLYIHILRRRGGLAKLLRRRMRRHHRAVQEDTSSYWDRCGAHLPIVARIRKMLGYESKYCLSCGQSGPKDDMEAFIHCANKDCNAVYCKACYADMGRICTVCMRPVEYGDMSDMSEERDSSDDEAFKDEMNSQPDSLTKYDDEKLDFSYQDQGTEATYGGDNTAPYMATSQAVPTCLTQRKS